MRKVRIYFIYFLFIPYLVHPQNFTEVSDASGMNYIYPGNDHQEAGAGVTILDVNNDGWDDVFQAGGIFSSKLWLNKHGVFVDVSEQYEITQLDSLFVMGAVSGDYNNDGFTDLFITNLSTLKSRGDNRPPVLLKNVEGNYFEPVFQEVFNEKGFYPSCSWGDYNNDGFIDLFVLNYIENMNTYFDSTKHKFIYNPKCLRNKFYQNIEGEAFIDKSAYYQLDDIGCGLASCFTDYDNDNDVDLILLNDFAQWNNMGNLFYRNEFPNDKFFEISHELGFYDEFYGMSVGPGDIDNDGIFDYYLTNIGQNRLYKNEVDTMIEVGKKLNVDLTFDHDSVKTTSWSGLFFDLENDGDVDLFVTKGYLQSFEDVVVLDKNKIFKNKNGRFRDISKGSGIEDEIVQRGAAYFDFDHDGDLDLVTGVIKMRKGEFGKLEQKIKLYRNENKKKNKWIGIQLLGSNGVNSDCLGCSVSMTMRNGKKQIREVDGGTGHSSQSTKTLYFGLGKQKYVYNIEIQWLGQETTTLKKIKSGHVYRVNRQGEIDIVY